MSSSFAPALRGFRGIRTIPLPLRDTSTTYYNTLTTAIFVSVNTAVTFPLLPSPGDGTLTFNVNGVLVGYDNIRVPANTAELITLKLAFFVPAGASYVVSWAYPLTVPAPTVLWNEFY